MAATFYSDLKSSLAVLLNLSCLLFSALLAQYLTENPLLMIGSIAFLFLSSMMFGVWGWSVFTMIGGLVLSAESVPTLLAFFSCSGSCLLLQFLGEKRVNVEKEDEEFHVELARELKQASLVEPQIKTPEEISLRELRKQFEEKSQHLHETRRQLFLLEGHLHTKKREQEELLFAKDPLLETWQNDLQTLLEENDALKKENQLLEELIAHPPKRRTRFSKPSIYTGSELFSMSSMETKV